MQKFFDEDFDFSISSLRNLLTLLTELIVVNFNDVNISPKNFYENYRFNLDHPNRTGINGEHAETYFFENITT